MFRTSGSTIDFKGFTRVYGEAEEDEAVKIPELKEKDVLSLKDIKANQHFTQPPARYTDASLVKTALSSFPARRIFGIESEIAALYVSFVTAVPSYIRRSERVYVVGRGNLDLHGIPYGRQIGDAVGFTGEIPEPVETEFCACR